MMAMANPYGEESLVEEASPITSGTSSDDKEIRIDDEGKMRNANGEEVQECPVCGGSGEVFDPKRGKIVECQNCRGDGLVQVRKR